MRIDHTIGTLTDAGIVVEVADGKLSAGPPELLTAERRRTIRSRRDDIISHLAFTCRDCEQPADLFDTDGIAWCAEHATGVPDDPAIHAALKHLAQLRPEIVDQDVA